MYNKNQQSDRQVWNVDLSEIPYDIPVEQQYGFFQQFQMPMYNPQFLWGHQMPNFQFQPHQQIQQLLDPIIVAQAPNNQKVKDIKSSRRRIQDQSHSKGNLKNTYINKIHGLMKESDDNPQEILDNEPVPIQRTSKEISSMKQKSILEDKLIGLSSKLERNRECAKNSRKRKKIYIELLESKKKSIEEELAFVKGEAKQTQNSYFNQTDIYHHRHKKILQLDEQLQEETNQQSMKDDEKQVILKLLFKEMINTNIPSHLLPLFSSNNQTKIMQDKQLCVSGDSQIQDRYDKIQQSKVNMSEFSELQLTDQQQDKITNLITNQTQKKQMLEELIFSMSDIMDQLFSEHKNIEQIIRTDLRLCQDDLAHLINLVKKNESLYDSESIFQTFKAINQK